MKRRVLVGFATVFAIAAHGATAWAEDAPPDPTPAATSPTAGTVAPRAGTGSSSNMVALARTEFDLGIEAARAERWTVALEHFRRAHELTDAPQVLLNIASALVQSGHFVEGAETYRRFLREAPDSVGELRTAASDALEQTVARTPRVTFEISNLATADEVLLDGAPLRAAALGAAVPVDPGRHRLTVVRAGTERGRREFTIAEGGSTTVTLALSAAPGSGGVLHSPVFWAIAGVVIVGAGVAIGFGAYSASVFQGNVPPGTVTLR